MIDGDIDTGLTLLLQSKVLKGITLSSRDIAFVCGCSHSEILRLEKIALRKLRFRFQGVLDSKVNFEVGLQNQNE